MAVIVLLTAASAHAAGQRDEIVRTERRSVSAGTGTALEIDHGSGHVRVRGATGSDILLQATFRVSARTRENAERFASALRLVVTPGATIRVRIETPAWNGRNDDVGFAVDLDVQMPERLPLTVANRFGETSIAGLKAPLTVRSGNGRVIVQDGEGNADLTNRFGNVEVRRLTGDLALTADNGTMLVETVSGSTTVKSRFGNILLSSIGRQVTATGMNGAIVIRDARGGVTVSSNFGAVQLERVTGPVTIKAGNGHVRGLGINGPVDVETRFGTVTLRDVTGPIDVQGSNGSIDVALPARGCEQASIETAFAPLVVYTGAAGYALTASAQFGEISSDVPVAATGTIAPRPGRPASVTGTIGDGRCPLQLTNRNGNIAIRSGPAPAPADVIRESSDAFMRRGPMLAPPGTLVGQPVPPAPAAAPRAPREPRARVPPGSAPVPPGSAPMPAPQP